jgi:hypothetical protein
VILFLAANPRDSSQLALDREARAIQLEQERGMDTLGGGVLDVAAVFELVATCGLAASQVLELVSGAGLLVSACCRPGTRVPIAADCSPPAGERGHVVATSCRRNTMRSVR